MLNEMEKKALKAETSYFKLVRKNEALQKRIFDLAPKIAKSQKNYHSLLFAACTSK